MRWRWPLVLIPHIHRRHVRIVLIETTKCCLLSASNSTACPSPEPVARSQRRPLGAPGELRSDARTLARVLAATSPAGPAGPVVEVAAFSSSI